MALPKIVCTRILPPPLEVCITFGIAPRVLLTELKHKPAGSHFECLPETPVSASFGETAEIIAQALDEILKAKKICITVDQDLLQAIGNIVDQKLEEKLNAKLSNVVETLKASFTQSLSTLSIEKH